MNEGDSTKEIQAAPDEGDPINVIQRYIANVGYVLSAVWLRCPIQTNNGSNWIVLGSRYSFLLYFRLFLFGLYLLHQIIK